MTRHGYDIKLHQIRWARAGARRSTRRARALRHVGGRVGLGAGAVDRGAAGGVGEPAEAGNGGGVMDLAGRSLLAWLSAQ
jgi:hypothetical protein